MSTTTKKTLPTSSTVGLVDFARIDCETPPISLQETPQDDVKAQWSRPIAALIFYLFQDLRLSQEKQKRRLDELEEGTNSRLDKLDKTLDDEQKWHTAQVEEALAHTQKCAADIEKLAQVQDKADAIYARDDRLTSEVARIDERLEISGNELKNLDEAVCSCVDKQNLEGLWETRIKDRVREAEENIIRQNKTLLELSEELHRLKDEMRAQKDQAQKKSEEKPVAASKEVNDKPLRSETELEDIYTADTQPLEKPTFKAHYNLRPRSQPSVEESAMAIVVSALPKASPITSSRSRQGAERKSCGTRTASKTVGAQKRTAAASDTDKVLNHPYNSKRRKQPIRQKSLAKVCCEAQWAYENCPEEKSEHEFITEFLKFSVKPLSSADKKRLIEALCDLATPDKYGLPVFRQDTDWSDIWEHLWTIKNVPGMYLNKVK
ncbi:uncharacterized protein PgNI_08798 [Pyricularia grisea]|uniref:Uncharacterized protein n=1 Tax=Pyricularia grisea TaxID=148305 RepID=A0A6P8AWM8_PYRGI|nr:uncharacterized protein PgNI_08798 [Pyricularia grisea]TLD06579.1 hypothetical protein PgNI_08798 [Pyricularia grisea]